MTPQLIEPAQSVLSKVMVPNTSEVQHIVRMICVSDQQLILMRFLCVMYQQCKQTGRKLYRTKLPQNLLAMIKSELKVSN